MDAATGRPVAVSGANAVLAAAMYHQVRVAAELAERA
jgi:hypothetical protein